MVLFYSLKPKPESYVIIDVLQKCLDKCKKNNVKKLFFSLSLCEVYRKFDNSNMNNQRIHTSEINKVAYDNYIKLVEIYSDRIEATIPTDKGYIFSKPYRGMVELDEPFSDLLDSSSLSVLNQLYTRLSIDKNSLSYKDREFLEEVKFTDIIKSNFSDKESEEILSQ